MVGIKAFVFEGRKSAQKALDTLDENTPAYYWLDDVAVVSMSKHGNVRVHSTWAQDDDQVEGGIGWGALTGGLVGALFGPAGVLLGAAGGAATGGLIGTTIALDLEDPRLTDFAMSLKNDTSAAILVAEEPVLGDFVKTFETFDAEVIETHLSEEDVKELRALLKK